MRSITITINMQVSEDFYEKELAELKDDILSGAFQREVMEGKKTKGKVKVKVTFKEH